jgi:hypothetical protein
VSWYVYLLEFANETAEGPTACFVSTIQQLRTFPGGLDQICSQFEKHKLRAGVREQTKFASIARRLSRTRPTKRGARLTLNKYFFFFGFVGKKQRIIVILAPPLSSPTQPDTPTLAKRQQSGARQARRTLTVEQLHSMQVIRSPSAYHECKSECQQPFESESLPASQNVTGVLRHRYVLSLAEEWYSQLASFCAPAHFAHGFRAWIWPIEGGAALEVVCCARQWETARRWKLCNGHQARTDGARRALRVPPIGGRRTPP